MKQEALAALVGEVVRRPAEISAIALIRAIELDASVGVLGQLKLLQEILDMYRLELVPPFTQGELDTLRLFRLKNPLGTLTEATLLTEMAEGESQQREFKATLLCDVEKNCRMDSLLFAALKTICAMLNSDGGVLMVGVTNDFNVCGLELDFQLPDTCDADKWQLFLRDSIRGRFYEGKLINDYVDVAVIQTAGRNVGYVGVIPRKRLSFVKDQHGVYLAYRRQGNRSESLAVTELEEFLRARWKI